MKFCSMCEKEITGESVTVGGYGLVHKDCGLKYLEDQKKMIESICKPRIFDNKK